MTYHALSLSCHFPDASAPHPKPSRWGSVLDWWRLTPPGIDLGSPKGKEYDVVSFFFVSFSNNAPVFVFLPTLNLQLSYTFVIPKSYVWALVAHLGPTRE